MGLFCGNELIYCLDTRRPQTQVWGFWSRQGGLPKPPKNPLKTPLFRGPKQGVLGPFLGGFWALFETLGGHPGAGGVPWGDTPGLGGYPGGTPRVWGGTLGGHPWSGGVPWGDTPGEGGVPWGDTPGLGGHPRGDPQVWGWVWGGTPGLLKSCQSGNSS